MLIGVVISILYTPLGIDLSLLYLNLFLKSVSTFLRLKVVNLYQFSYIFTHVRKLVRRYPCGTLGPSELT